MNGTVRVCIFIAGLVFGTTAWAQDQSAIEAGAQVYAEHCALCHGERLMNTGTAFDLRRLGADERPRLEMALEDGKGQMPSFSGQLNAEEINQLWAYIRSRADN